MSTYWDAYPNFVHNTTAPLQQEFKLLAAQCGWSGEKYKKEWARCGVEEFSHHFGRDDNRLAGWQAMCALVQVDEVPDSIKKCKQVLRTTVWVNIFDLVDAKRTGEPVKKHASAEALRKYSKKHKKIFPKKTAKENRFLTVLLIEMF
ncbi:hypothetical protein MVEN_01967800 [Mycena venus]|uniref:Uncharacterized protein n=1 Tax=Mycena venus TaxID=2733690 RepID=A0A8H6XHI9_9AGAR|nr:hypothetical protein MVEN_01967800 [Mycena venus]